MQYWKVSFEENDEILKRYVGRVKCMYYIDEMRGRFNQKVWWRKAGKFVKIAGD